MKIENSRLDIVSHKRFPKDELIRLVNSNGNILLDENNNLGGRGFYIHKDEQSIKRAVKIIQNIYHVEINDEFITKLLRML